MLNLCRIALVAAVTVSAVAFSACGDEAAELEFSNLRAEAVTATSAILRFDTSLPTTCEVEYGLAIDELDLTATDPTMGEDDPYSYDHEVPVEDLLAGRTYYWRGRAEDADGNVYRSGIQSFETLAAGGPTFANLALLEDGATVTGVSSNFGDAANDERWGADAAFDGLMSSDVGDEWRRRRRMGRGDAGSGDDVYALRVSKPRDA